MTVPEGKVVGSMAVYEHSRVTHPVEDKPPTSKLANVRIWPRGTTTDAAEATSSITAKQASSSTEPCAYPYARRRDASASAADLWRLSRSAPRMAAFTRSSMEPP